MTGDRGPGEPLTPWSPAPGTGQNGSDDPARRFFNGTPIADLGLGDSIRTGFRVLTKLSFFLPVLIMTAVITLTLGIAIEPLVRDRFTLTPDDLASRVPLLVSSGIAAIIGSLLTSTYGQVWLALASSTGEPTFSVAIRATMERWLAVIGAGLLTFALYVVVALPLFLINNPAVLLVLLPVFIYLGCRLAFATWLAADGRGPIEAIRASWSMSRGQLLRIVGWNVALGIVLAIVGLVLELVLGGSAIGAATARGVTLAIQFGAGVALFRKVQADAAGTEAPREERGDLR